MAPEFHVRIGLWVLLIAVIHLGDIHRSSRAILQISMFASQRYSGTAKQTYRKIRVLIRRSHNDSSAAPLFTQDHTEAVKFEQKGKKVVAARRFPELSWTPHNMQLGSS